MISDNRDLIMTVRTGKKAKAFPVMMVKICQCLASVWQVVGQCLVVGGWWLVVGDWRVCGCVTCENTHCRT